MKNNVIKLNKIEKRNIVEDNDFLRARSRLTTTQFKILLTAISRISVNEKDFMRYTFKTKELANYCGLYGAGERGTSCYSNLKIACEGLMDKKIRLREGIHKEKIFPWISTLIYDEGSVTIEIHHELKPFLLDLKQDFTKFDSNLIMEFNHYYTMKLYMLLYSKFVKINSYVDDKHKCKSIEEQIPLEDLKEILGLEKEKYQLTSGFKRRIIKPACKEIEEITPFDIEYIDVKKGKAVSAFRFSFRYNYERAKEYDIADYKKITIGCDDKKDISLVLSADENESTQTIVSLPNKNQEQINNVLNKLRHYGVKGYKKIVEKYIDKLDNVEKNIDYVIKKYSSKKDANLGGLIIKAIVDDYVGGNVIQTKIKQKEKEIKSVKQQESHKYQEAQINLFQQQNAPLTVSSTKVNQLHEFMNRLKS